MREYTTTDGQRIRSIGREKRIMWTASGEPYFMWSGRREYMSDVMRLTYPIMYETDRGTLYDIGGYIGISNVYGVLVEILDGGEAVQLWEEIEND